MKRNIQPPEVKLTVSDRLFIGAYFVGYEDRATAPIGEMRQKIIKPLYTALGGFEVGTTTYMNFKKRIDALDWKVIEAEVAAYKEGSNMKRNVTPAKGISTRKFRGQTYYYIGRTENFSKANSINLELSMKGIGTAVTRSGGDYFIWATKPVYVPMMEVGGYELYNPIKKNIYEKEREMLGKTFRVTIPWKIGNRKQREGDILEVVDYGSGMASDYVVFVNKRFPGLRFTTGTWMFKRNAQSFNPARSGAKKKKIL